MKKLDIANYVAFDLANRFCGAEHSDLDNEVIDLLAKHWTKKHFISSRPQIKNYYNEKERQKFLI